MTDASIDIGSNDSVMAGGGYYSANSRPQHVAAEVAYPYLMRAVGEVPGLQSSVTAVIGDFGCAGGTNEMEPMALAIDGLRSSSPGKPVQVVHTDLPQNDFGPLFDLLQGPDSYLVGRSEVYPAVIGRTLYGPLFPTGTLTLGWSSITLHWLSSMPCTVQDQVYANLTTGADREALRARSAQDWELFLTERARELVDEGQLVLVAGASRPDGSSGAEALFRVIGDVFDGMVADATLTAVEAGRIFYPTWNRTPEEWLAPFAGPHGDVLEVLEHRLDRSDDAASYPQFARDRDAVGLAAAYVRFVRAITEHPFFRSLDPSRPPAERATVVDEFYRRLQSALALQPDATAHWHVMSLRIRRRPRS